MKQVSVIIPFYNVELYIEECLSSILKQTLKNIEIICVNDGSTDQSVNIVEHYAEIDDRIIIINKENGGVSSARNAGLTIATGKYVYFMDSDDILKENALLHLYNEAEKEQLDTIFFDADSFYENDNLKNQHSSYTEYYHRKANYNSVMSGIELTVNMISNNEFRPAVCLQFNRKSLLIENNLAFYNGIIHEDNLFTLLASIYSKRAKYISERFYLRRLRDNSIMTARNSHKGCYGYFICIKELYQKIAQLVPEEEHRNAYIHQLRRMRSTAVKDICHIFEKEEELPAMRNAEEEVLFKLLINDYAELVYTKDEQISTLQRVCLERDTLIHNLRGEIKDSEIVIQHLNKDFNALTNKFNILNKNLRLLKNSNSYKIGRIITFIPRMLRSIKKKLFK